MRSASVKTFDVRLPDASNQIREEFDRLSVGAGVRLIGDRDPRSLYTWFRKNRPDLFGWRVVDSRNGSWSVELTRLPPKESETSLQAYFERDHDEIDVLFGFLRRDVEDAASNPSATPSGIIDLFGEFDERLSRHIRWEEEVLFPEVERRSPEMAFGPGRVMRQEHQEIQRLKSSIRALLAEGLMARASRNLNELLSILSGHNQKEECVYYPLSERMFSPADAADLLRRVRLMNR